MDLLVQQTDFAAMTSTISILFIEDSPDDHQLMRIVLREYGLRFEDRRLQRLEDIEELLSSGFQPDIYILDFDVPGYHIEQFQALINRMHPHASVIVVSGTITEEQLKIALKSGAADYVMKENLRRLPVAIMNEYQNARARRQLVESRSRADEATNLLKIYLENIDDVISIHNQDGRYLYASPSAYNVFGFTPDELMQQDSYSYVYPDDCDVINRAMELTLLDHMLRTIRWRRRHKDGNFIWLETKIKALLNGDKQVQKIICATRNITKYKHAEEALQASERRFKTLVKNSGDMFSLVNEEGLCIYNSPSFYTITGYTEDEIVGKTVFQFLHPDDTEQIQKTFFQEIGELGISDLYVYRFRISNGSYLYFESRGSNQLADSTLNAIILNTRDISERVRVKLELEQQNKHIEKLALSTIGYLNLSADDNHYDYIAEQLRLLVPGSIIVVNEYNQRENLITCKSITGVEDVNEIFGKYADRVTVGTTFTPTDQALTELKEGKIREVEGGLYTLLFQRFPKKLSDFVQSASGIVKIYSMGLMWEGNLFGNVVLMTTESSGKVNEKVVETFLNVASVALQRKRAEELIVESLHEKTVLLKEVHHRVKNNLQIVSSLLELQAYQVNDTKMKELFNDSQTRVRSMALVHERLYQSSNLSKIQYEEYVNQLVSYLFDSYMPKNIRKEVITEPVELGIDEAVPLGIIINELVTNSIKYAYPDGQDGVIRILLSETREGRIRLIVEDEGVGLPQSVRVGEHSTLGLELVNALVQQLDAVMSVDSSRGTKVTIQFKPRS
jgi:PAS domain S-box-containing protein